MGSHCVSLFLWQMSCSVAMFNWQICQLCINLCKLHRPYLIPEMGPGVAWFHPMAQPVGHGGEMTRNWRQLRVVTPWHTLNKQPWASYCFFFFSRCHIFFYHTYTFMQSSPLSAVSLSDCLKCLFFTSNSLKMLLLMVCCSVQSMQSASGLCLQMRCVCVCVCVVCVHQCMLLQSKADNIVVNQHLQWLPTHQTRFLQLS